MFRLASAWRRLPPAERADALRAAIAIPTIAIAVRVAGYQRLLDWLGRRPVSSVVPLDARAVERRCVLALGRAIRHAPYRGNCLSQSLALFWMLRRHAVDGVIRLGARIDDGAFLAHAWVEREDRVLNDTADVRQRFAPFEAAVARSLNR